VSPAPTSDVDADEASLEQWENEVGEIMQPHTQKE
jgi:hypothetical protein